MLPSSFNLTDIPIEEATRKTDKQHTHTHTHQWLNLKPHLTVQK